jgi:hypothetical protein
MANLPNVSLETICLHPPDPYMTDIHGIGSACAEYQRTFIENRLWRNASRAKEQHAAGTSHWWLKGCFCLSSFKTTYTALFITFDSVLGWCCRKSVQDERCIKVDYSLVVDVAMDGLPIRLNRALFAAMSGTTWVRPLFGERGRGLLCIIWLTVSSLMGPKINDQAAASRRRSGQYLG